MPLAVVCSGLVALIIWSDRTPTPSGPWDMTHNCPTRISVDGTIRDTGRPTVPWVIFISDLNGNAAHVDVNLDRGQSVPGIDGGACVLEILRVPGPDVNGTDWRIGTTVIDGASFAGGKAKMTIYIRADRDFSLSSSAFYAYDGVNVPGRTVAEISPEWRRYVLEFQISDTATTLEMWFRLAIHGTVSDKGTIWLAGAQIELTSPGRSR